MFHYEQDIKTDDKLAFKLYCEMVGGEDDKDRAAHNFIINRRGTFDTVEEAAIAYAGEEAPAVFCYDAETEEERLEVILEWLYLDHYVFDHLEGVLVIENMRPYYSNGHDNVPSLTGAW